MKLKTQLIYLVISLLIFSCNNGLQDDDIQVSSINITSNKNSLHVNETINLNLIYTPTNSIDSKVSWSSSNDKVATVNSEGVVKGISIGKVEIFATLNDTDISDFIIINVVPILANNVTINKLNGDISIDNSNTQLSFTIDPPNADITSLIWKSSNEEIAQIDQDGKITPKDVGEVSFTLNIDNITDTITTKISPVVATSIEIENPPSQIFVGGESLELSTSILPLNVTDYNVLWESSNESILKVNNLGEVFGVSPGEANIKVLCGAVTDTISIKVLPIVAESISIIEPSQLIYVNDKAVQLSVNFNPLNTTDKNIQWQSSDVTIATVDNNGIITGLKEGKISITARSGNLKSTIDLTIYPVLPTSLEITNEIDKIYINGENTILETNFYPTNTTNKEVRWESSDPSIASIDSEGKISAYNWGNVIFTAYWIHDESISDNISLYSKKVEITIITNGEGLVTRYPEKEYYDPSERIEIDFNEITPGWGFNSLLMDGVDFPYEYCSTGLNLHSSSDVTLEVTFTKFNDNLTSYFYGSVYDSNTGTTMHGYPGTNSKYIGSPLETYNEAIIKDNVLNVYLKNNNLKGLTVKSVGLYSYYSDGLKVCEAYSERADLLSDYFLEGDEIIHMNWTFREEQLYRDVKDWKVVWQLSNNGIDFEYIYYWTGPIISP